MGGVAMLGEAATLLRKHHRIHTLLDQEGGLFGLGGIKEHAITLVWHLKALTFSLSPEVARIGRDLAATIPKHSRASMADVFPSRDGGSWLAAEVVRHLRAGLADPAIVGRG